jgi:hypothetical protein
MPAIIVTNTFYTPIPMPGIPYNRYWNKVKEILEQAIADTGISRITDYGLQLAISDFSK